MPLPKLTKLPSLNIFNIFISYSLTTLLIHLPAHTQHASRSRLARHRLRPPAHVPCHGPRARRAVDAEREFLPVPLAGYECSGMEDGGGGVANDRSSRCVMSSSTAGRPEVSP